MLDFVLIRHAWPVDSADAALGLRAIQAGLPPHAEVLVGMSVEEALALKAGSGCGRMLYLESCWLSLDARCWERLEWGLSQGLDVAVACDSVSPEPMPAVGYATLRGMERQVAGVEPAVAGLLPGFAGRVAVGSVDGWQRVLQGRGRVARVAGAWAHDSSGYFGSDRQEMLPLVPVGLGDVLDVGGGEGGFLSALKQREPGVQTHLVELTEQAASVARACGGVDQVWVGSFLDWRPARRFDCISFLDVLEHMVDPERALRHAVGLLRPGGGLVLSIPNVGHWSVVADLLEGRWDWAPAGIHCYTHVRFFTRRTIEDMLNRLGLEAEAWIEVKVPASDEWLEAWGVSRGLVVDRDALQTYAYGLRVRPRREA